MPVGDRPAPQLNLPLAGITGPNPSYTGRLGTYTGDGPLPFQMSYAMGHRPL
jgi:hypothetical protein